MKRMFIGALLAGVATSALAADLPTSKPAPPVAYAPPPIFIWTGFYLGANGLYGWGDTHGPGAAVFGNPSGGMGGVTAGYNYQIGQFVTGLEGDVDFGDISNNQTVDAAARSANTMSALSRRPRARRHGARSRFGLRDRRLRRRRSARLAF